MKLRWIVTLLFVVVLLGCSGPFALFGENRAAAVPTQVPTSTSIMEPADRESPTTVYRPPTQVPPTSTPVLTAVPIATPTNSPTSAPTGALSIVTPTVMMTSTNGVQTFARDLCLHGGEVAWHAENQLDGSLYGEAPVGGMSEVCGMVIQLWTRVGPERFLIYLPPYTVMWIAGHSGGTGWYADSSLDVAADLQKQANELLARDGEMKTTFIILPGDAAKFRLLTRIQVQQPTIATPTATPTTTPQLTVTATAQVIAGKCNIGGESVGPCILEGNVDGKPTVIKLNTGVKYTLAAGGCFSFPSQAALDTRWSTHKAEYLAKYPNGQAVEK